MNALRGHLAEFSDTATGAKASAVIYSLVPTCRACEVDPYAWLRHVLTELPQRTTDRRRHRGSAALQLR